MFVLIFFNYFLYKEIIFENNHNIIKFLYLFALTFFNLSFTRLAEFGTDKVGQLLIIILIIKIFQLTCFNNKNKINDILFTIPLLAFCITLKTYFLPYILLGITIFFLKGNIYKNFKIIFNSKSFLFLIVSLFFYFTHHFISTGCIISPLSITCFGDNLYWAENSKSYKDLSLWLEQWAKGGAGPNFRVDDPKEYIQNFNWVSNWIEKYFIGKFFEQLQLLLFIFLLVFLFFKKFKLIKNIFFFDKKILYFYLIILSIFLIWFMKHLL